MSKGTYDVQKGEIEGRSRRDSSYGSFLCAILIFLILCVIIIIAGNWSKIVGGKKKSGYEDARENKHEKYDPNEDMEFFQKFVVASTESQKILTTKSYFTQPTTTTTAPLITTRKTTTTTDPNPVHLTTTRHATTKDPSNQITTRKHQTNNLTTTIYEDNIITAPLITTRKTTTTTDPNPVHLTTTRHATTKDPSNQITTRKHQTNKLTTTIYKDNIITAPLITTRKTTTTTDSNPVHLTTTQQATTKDPSYPITTRKHQTYHLTTTIYEDNIITAKKNVTKSEEGKKFADLTTTPKYPYNDEIQTTTDESTTLLVHEGLIEMNTIGSENKLKPEISKHESTTDIFTEEIEDDTSTSDVINDSKMFKTVEHAVIVKGTTEINNLVSAKITETEDNSDLKKLKYLNHLETTEATTIDKDSISSYVTGRGKENTLFKDTTEDSKFQKKADVDEYITMDSTTEDFITYITEETVSNKRRLNEVVAVEDSNTDSTTEDFTTDVTSDTLSNIIRYNEAAAGEDSRTDSTTEDFTTKDLSEYTISNKRRYNKTVAAEDSTGDLTTDDFTMGGTEDTISTERRYNESVTAEDSNTVSTTDDSTTDVTEYTFSGQRRYSNAVAIKESNTDSTTEDNTDSTIEGSTVDSTTEEFTTDANLLRKKYNKTIITENNDYITFTESTTYEGSGFTKGEDKISTIETEDTTEDSETTKPMNISDFHKALHKESTTTGSTEKIESTTMPYGNNKYTTSSSQLTQGTTVVKNPFISKDAARVCIAPECKSVASSMLSLMNDSEDLCEDFYTFACGSSKFHTESNTAVWDILLKQTLQINKSNSKHLVTFRSFYDRCVDFHYRFSYQKRVDQVKMLLKSFGMESFRSAEICEMDFIFQKLLSVNSMYFMEVGFDIGNGEDEHILKLGPSLESSGEIGPWSALRANQRRCLAEQRHKIYDAHLNLEKIHESYAECLENHVEFRQLLHDAIEAFGYGKNQNINQHFTINYLNKLLGIRPSNAEIFLAKINKNFTTMTIANLQRDFPQVNWKNIFSVVQEKKIDSKQLVHVYFKDYLTRWFEIFSSINEKKWLLINLLITDLYYNFVVHKVNNDVENYCLKTSATYLGDIASNLYLNNFQDTLIDKHEKRVQDIFHILKSKFSDSLKNNSEFSDMSSYLNNLSVVFSSKREVASDEKLERKYDNFGIFSSYQEYLLMAKKFKMSHLGDVFEGQVDAFEGKPTSFYQRNKIYVPLGMVVDIPFNLPNHITFAKIGIKLAQSIAKHFDPVSIMLSHPQLTNKNSYEGLISNANSFLPYIEKKFNKFTVKVDAAMTINERMSDNTALRLLTDAHEGTRNDSVVPWISSSYSREKVMYVAVAQEFCDGENVLDYMVKMHESGELPGAVRIYNMFMNSEAFAKVFECAQGSGMNENPLKAQFPYADSTDQYPEYVS